MTRSSLEYQATRVHGRGEDGGGEAVLGDVEWRRIAGLRVVVSWPQSGYAPPPRTRTSLRARMVGVLGTLLIMGGLFTIGFVLLSQVHAPEPSWRPRAAVGAEAYGPSLHRSAPVSVDIPAIGVSSKLLHLGVERQRRHPGAVHLHPGERRGVVQVLRDARPDRGVGHRRPPRQLCGACRLLPAGGPAHRGQGRRDARRRGHRCFPRHRRAGSTSNPISRRKPFTVRPTSRLCA